jgi:hypothetical protein
MYLVPRMGGPTIHCIVHVTCKALVITVEKRVIFFYSTDINKYISGLVSSFVLSPIPALW